MECLRFALDVEEDWPPVAIESVQCAVHGDIYELLNAPFFIKGLAWGDKFRAVPDSVNGCIFEFEIVEESGHSLVWVLKNSDSDFSNGRAALAQLGCRVEALPAFALWSVDVPPLADEASVELVLDELEEDGFAVAVPVWRYDE